MIKNIQTVTGERTQARNEAVENDLERERDVLIVHIGRLAEACRKVEIAYETLSDGALESAIKELYIALVEYRKGQQQ
jgi:hypothetical protein